MPYTNEMSDSTVRINFGVNAPVAECADEGELRDWSGFAERWVAAYSLPETTESADDYWQAVINANLREVLPLVVDWAIQRGVADELSEYWDYDEFVPALAEILFVRVYGSNWNGYYCDGAVGSEGIALVDLGRLAMAFVEAYEGWCSR